MPSCFASWPDSVRGDSHAAAAAAADAVRGTISSHPNYGSQAMCLQLPPPVSSHLVSSQPSFVVTLIDEYLKAASLDVKLSLGSTGHRSTVQNLMELIIIWTIVPLGEGTCTVWSVWLAAPPLARVTTKSPEPYTDQLDGICTREVVGSMLHSILLHSLTTVHINGKCGLFLVVRPLLLVTTGKLIH